jgi:hypothetical protein
MKSTGAGVACASQRTCRPPDVETTMSDSQGVLFPLDEHRERSTLRTNQAAWADAARAADADLAGRIEASERWHADYLANVRAVTELGARSADAATRMPDVARPGAGRVHVPPATTARSTSAWRSSRPTP